MGEDAAQVIIRRSRLQALVRIKRHLERTAMSELLSEDDQEHLGNLIDDACINIPGGERERLADD